MSLRWSMFWLWLLVVTAGSVLPARAHPANEANIYHGLYVKVEPGRLTVEHASIVGGLLAQIVWPQWDTDGDQLLSPTEQARAVEQLTKHLSVTVDGRAVPLTLASEAFASHQEFFTSAAPAAHLRFTTPLPAVPAAGLEVAIHDETWPQFRPVFPDPQVTSEGLSTGTPVVTDGGRTVTLLVRPAGAASASTGVPSNTPAKSGTVLPGLSLSNGPLTVPGSTASQSAPPEGAANAPLRDLDLRKAPLFPERGKVLWAQTKEPHSETAGLKGLLGKRISLGLILLGLGAALLAGMAHALTPGHGKAMVGAYLVGSRGTVGDAIILGIVVTITHTLGVYLLGFLCLWLTTRIQADVVGNWLGVVSGVLVLGMGFWLFQRGLLAYHGLRELPGHSHGPGGHTHGHSHAHEHSHSHAHEHSHSHAHSHGHGHSHAHAHTGGSPAAVDAERRPPSDSPLEDYRRGEPAAAPRRQTKWDLIGLGVAGGMVPCFDALAILIAAVNLGNIAFGLALIAAFSLGLALVLVLIGILMVKAKDLMSRFSEESRWVKVMPAVSGAALFLLGTWLTIESLVDAGVVKFG